MDNVDVSVDVSISLVGAVITDMLLCVLCASPGYGGGSRWLWATRTARCPGV